MLVLYSSPPFIKFFGTPLGLYKVHLTLENRKYEVIGYQSLSGETAGGAGWGKVSVSLIIPEGSERLMWEGRYLTVQNDGKSDKFWAGCHGTNIRGFPSLCVPTEI